MNLYYKKLKKNFKIEKIQFFQFKNNIIIKRKSLVKKEAKENFSLNRNKLKTINNKNKIIKKNLKE